VGIHPAGEAARVIFRFGLWPAALELWGIAPNDPRANQWERARWKDGQLILPGLAPLPLPAIAAKAHARNGVTGAMAHSFNRWAWSQATFAVNAQAWTADIDALAVRRGAGKYVRIDRSSVKFPPTNLNRSGPTYTALCGSVVRIEIDRGTGALRIARAYSVLECGQALVPQLVLGQAQGGFAMGVGYACSSRCRFTRMDRAMGNGTSINTVSHGGRTCRSTGSRLRYCRPLLPTNGRRAWPKS
jgi:CO/xanthine dehydrogenase Mo-binding subunit